MITYSSTTLANVTDGASNLSPFFSHNLTDIYNAENNPNGYWMDNGTSYGWTKNSKFTFTQLEDGWLHVHVDNSSGTATIRNDCCVPKYNPSIKRATKYTFLVEFRNNQSTGVASGSDFYLVQQGGSVQFWGQNTTTAPYVRLEGIGNNLSEVPSDGSYAFSRFTKYSEPEGESSHWITNEKMVTFTFRANAGAILDYDVRLSIYEGEYWGGYVPYIISDVTDIRKSAEEANEKIDNLKVGGRNLLRRTGNLQASDLVLSRASLIEPNIIRITPTTSSGYAKFAVDYLNYDNYKNSTFVVSMDVHIADVESTYTTSNNLIVYYGVSIASRINSIFGSSYDCYYSQTINDLTTDWQRVSITFTIPDDLKTGQTSALVENSQVTIQVAEGQSRSPIEIRNVKLEVGNHATDWTPAPEDTEANIQQVQDNLDNLEIGGRNLFIGTSRFHGENNAFVTESNKLDNYYTYFNNGSIYTLEPFHEGDTITLQAKSNIPWNNKHATDGTGVNTVGFWIQAFDTSEDARNRQNLKRSQFLTNDLGDNSVIFKKKWTIPASDNGKYYCFRFNSYSDGTTVVTAKFWDLKLEKGAKVTDWTPAPEDMQTDIDTALAQSVEYIIGTQTAATGNWTGVSSTLTELKDGIQIRYWLPYAGSGNATLNLTLKDGTSTGAIPIYRQGGSANSSGVVTANRVTTHFPAGTSVSMVYGVNRIVSAVYSGTTYTGTFTGWFADGAYDSGNTINRTRMQNAITAETAITAAHIICGTATGYKNIGAGINFDLSYPILYAVSAIAATKTGDNNYLQINGINASNNGTITSGAAKKVLYLKGTVSGNIFTISTSPFMTTVAPTSADGFYYIPLGVMYSATGMYFTSSNRLYAYIDGAFQPVDTAAVLRAQDAKDRATAVYGTCSTGATTVDKIITCSNFTLFDGARIQITFTNANTAIASETTTASPTLNINGTGRKPIKIGIEEANTANPLYWAAGATIEFVYDGSAWVLQNAPYTLYGTCDTEENVREKQVVCDGAVVCKGTTIYVDMSYSNTADSNSENGNVTLNVANTIAKTIYANNATLTVRSRYNWNAGENPSFTFDGQYWQMDKDTVPAYITDKDEDGIFVHPINDTTSGWSIGKVFELLNNGYSYIKMWLEDVTDNLSAKIRIGREDQHHILLDKEIIKFKKGDTSEELASFSSSGISFDEGVPFKIGNDSTYVQFVDNDSDGVADALEIVADKISFKNGGDDNTTQDIQERFNDLQTDISNITNNIEINPTANTPYVAITTQKDEYNAGLKLEPTQLSFQLNGQTTATIANDEMNIPTASVTNLFMQSANQSYEKIWVMRSNGHLSLKVGKQN